MDDFGSIRFEVDDINHSKSSVSIYPDKSSISNITQRTKPYKSIPEMFRPALEQTADYVRDTMIPRIFRNEGPGWRPLAPRTISERVAAGYMGKHPILYRSGDLFESLTDKSHPQHVEVIKVGKSSRIEVGSMSKKFVENQRGNTDKHLPARPMLPGTGGLAFPSGDRLQIEQIFKRVKERSKK